MKRAVFLFFLQIINFLSGIFVVVIVVGVCACLQVCEQLNLYLSNKSGRQGHAEQVLQV